MNHINTLSFVILSLACTFVCPRVQAASSYWAAVETSAYTGDESDGGNLSAYAMYYCAVDTATFLFGGSSVEKIEAYVKSNFADAKSRAVTYDSVAFSDDEYQIVDYVSAAFGSADYVAYALYGSNAYRVFGKGSATLTPYGQLAFNESYAAAGTIGEWHQVIPEPTSGVLLLLGLAGLALRRRRISAA